MASFDPAEAELALNRFKRLFGELISGETRRNTFQLWEIELVLDFHGCAPQGKRRLEILRQYERAVFRQLQSQSGPPLKLSEFLAIRDRRRQNSTRRGPRGQSENRWPAPALPGQNPPPLDSTRAG